MPDIFVAFTRYQTKISPACVIRTTFEDCLGNAADAILDGHDAAPFLAYWNAWAARHHVARVGVERMIRDGEITEEDPPALVEDFGLDVIAYERFLDQFHGRNLMDARQLELALAPAAAPAPQLNRGPAARTPASAASGANSLLSWPLGRLSAATRWLGVHMRRAAGAGEVHSKNPGVFPTFSKNQVALQDSWNPQGRGMGSLEFRIFQESSRIPTNSAPESKTPKRFVGSKAWKSKTLQGWSAPQNEEFLS